MGGGRCSKWGRRRGGHLQLAEQGQMAGNGSTPTHPGFWSVPLFTPSPYEERPSKGPSRRTMGTSTSKTELTAAPASFLFPPRPSLDLRRAGGTRSFLWASPRPVEISSTARRRSVRRRRTRQDGSSRRRRPSSSGCELRRTRRESRTRISREDGNLDEQSSSLLERRQGS